MPNEAYITKASKFLPNLPVGNDEIEKYLGLIHHQHSKSKRIVLRNNGIKRRFYAIDKNGKTTHTNSEMVSLAIRSMLDNDAEKIKNVDLLSCGTGTPDQMIPSHAAMVHGWLPEASNIEVVSPAGACCSGMHALKYAWMAVKLGEAKNAIAAGSERASGIMRSTVYEEEANKLATAEENPNIVFDKEFLRWMLSDGAGVVLISDKKNKSGISLRIDWLEGSSFAHQIEPCMYSACEKSETGILKSYMEFTPSEIAEHSILSIKQDVKLLDRHILSLGCDKLVSVLEKHKLNINDIDYYLPHISSEFFRKKMAETLRVNGLEIPPGKWFTNLSRVGNVGAGSIYLMVEELFNSGQLKKGQKIFIVVPESARFSYMFGLFTVC